MTWAEFIAAVKEELPIDAQRLGTDKLLDRSLRAAAADLQAFLPWLRQGNTTSHLPAAFTTDGFAAWVAAPAGTIREVNLLHSTADETRPGSSNHTPLARRTWAWKDAMVTGLDTAMGVWTLTPDLGQLWIAPHLLAGQSLSVVWDGIRDFAPTSTGDLGSNWSQPGVTLAAGHFVKERFAKLVDHDLAAAQAHAGDYLKLRQRLYADFKERAA